MSFSFERPLLALALLPVLVLVLLLSRFFRNPLVLRFPLGPPGGVSFKPPFRMEILIRILGILELCAFLLLGIAAAGPRLASAATVWLNRGADILFMIDISPSMAGLDMNGQSRMDAARDLVKDFALRRPSDAIGLGALGNEAALLVPATIDRDALLSRLEGLTIGELGDGTALGTGLAAAALHIRNSAAPRKAVILITDGENNAGAVHPETAAAALGELGISFWIIGLGSRGEVPIDYVDPFNRIRRTGTFDSRFDAESLRSLARSGNGVYIAAPSAEAFAAAFARIDAAEVTVRRSRTVNRYTPFHGPLIIAGVLIFCAVRLIRRWFLGALL